MVVAVVALVGVGLGAIEMAEREIDVPDRDDLARLRPHHVVAIGLTRWRDVDDLVGDHLEPHSAFGGLVRGVFDEVGQVPAHNRPGQVRAGVEEPVAKVRLPLRGIVPGPVEDAEAAPEGPIHRPAGGVHQVAGHIGSVGRAAIAATGVEQGERHRGGTQSHRQRLDDFVGQADPGGPAADDRDRELAFHLRRGWVPGKTNVAIAAAGGKRGRPHLEDPLSGPVRRSEALAALAALGPL